ncbi:uncharacterized protein ACB058_002595 [Synchiropus picturatus]
MSIGTSPETRSNSVLMVHLKTRSGFSHFVIGMEIAVLLLLTVSLTAALPLKPILRSDTVLQGDTVRSLEVERSADTQEQHASSLKIIPFTSEVQRLDWDSVKQRLAVMSRSRRATKRACKLGTCQLHILANTLYQISKTNGKDESEKANDPQGYGR